jgi:hypothetical protein
MPTATVYYDGWLKLPEQIGPVTTKLCTLAISDGEVGSQPVASGSGLDGVGRCSGCGRRASLASAGRSCRKTWRC